MGTVVSQSTVQIWNGQSQGSNNGFTITGTTAGNALLILFSGNQPAASNPNLVSGFTASAGTAPTMIYQQARGAVKDTWVGAAIVPVGPGGSVTYVPQYTVANSSNSITGYVVQISGLSSTPLDNASITGAGLSVSATSLSVGPTAILAQPDSMVISLFTAIGTGGTNANISNSSGSLTALNAQQNGTLGNTLWAGYKNVSATTTQTVAYTHNSASAGNAGLIFVLKNGTGAPQRFKFTTDPAAANASGVNAIVWDGSAGLIGNKVSEYSGLTFQPTAVSGQAILYADATGKGFVNGNTVKGIAFNTLNTTGIIAVTVEAGSA